MIVIADSNVIFSALIRPAGSEAAILKAKGRIQFYAPGYLLEEIREHWEEIEKYTTLSHAELRKEFEFLKNKLRVIEISSIPRKTITAAYEIVKDIDEEDTYFVAMHLYKKYKIWTGDIRLIKGLKMKGYDFCITTAELRKSMYRK